MVWLEASKHEQIIKETKKHHPPEVLKMEFWSFFRRLIRFPISCNFVLFSMFDDQNVKMWVFEIKIRPQSKSSGLFAGSILYFFWTDFRWFFVFLFFSPSSCGSRSSFCDFLIFLWFELFVCDNFIFLWFFGHHLDPTLLGIHIRIQKMFFRVHVMYIYIQMYLDNNAFDTSSDYYNKRRLCR